MSAVARQQPLAPPPLLPDTLELVEMSHSRKTTMQRCGRAYRYKYVDRLDTKLKSATLGYGGCVHKGAAASLTAQAFSGVITDPTPVFEKAWNDYVAKNAIEYSKDWDEDEMRKTGCAVLLKFMEDWKDRGFEVVCDAEGMPVIERELRIRLPGNIIYIAILDALVRTPDGKIIVLDFKTPMQVSKPEFYMLSDQLLGYQVVCDAHAEALGIEKVDGALFYELTKVKIPKQKSRGQGPQIHVTEVIPRRSQEDIDDWILENQFVANDIRNKRHTRRPTDSFDSSCLLCDFQKICSGRPDPNIFKKPQRRNFVAPENIDTGVPF